MMGKTHSPKVSVIMPVYNVPQTFLREAVESILNQSYENFELLVVDDCSDDDILPVLFSYGDARVKYIRNRTNIGIAASLNRGIAEAQGELIARMDADDISEPKRFEKQVEYLSAHPEVSILGTNYQVIGTQRFSNHPEYVSYLTLLKGCYVAHPSVMWRKSDLEQYGLRYNEELACAQDYDLWSRAIHFVKIANLPDVLLSYRLHEGSISSLKGKEQTRIAKNIQQRMVGFVTNDIQLQQEILRAARGEGKDTRRVYLFGFIPIIVVRATVHKVKVLLFGVIPLCTIFRDRYRRS